ncbi:NADPH-dependent assimilatory sulfite reductase hemoprotein subunit [Meiothermus ruber]|jgi:sulfite reductase (ferredoxin)|uniref:Sulfite reductase (NADPH) n=1 Tax=Meiothermus ruber (strain ATCC 35948 / DSM 1279 / VKM B-1258 / 21) TaxID=504728 RepID=D3PPZ1_MEIRD|nr:NADPH-dependent assimilatory sulfite reductase hemoprotein subunit [Meiothermus ruber]GIW39381.1 MAG: sulfite reductase subunit beta [Meiothermus sp.]ADD27617.1 Sulfite reductase (NADPH) [Meiothermus ruber DSM 1279]AGK04082.1 sulfite reductase subunit beta [Meiothermus ruber DSM 1279]MCL6531132.1 NADPH-dependent assimilatory sulfite reductase hemoprotein subunit [Meiothermus ruber]GAO74545.1 sulfite reductas [Meiothermus ruber H328]
MSSQSKVSKVESIKLASRNLRGPVDLELNNPSDHFSEEGYQILKFHGIYQQDDRDVRKARKAQGLGPDYSFMIRVAIPGGVLQPEQYLALDRLADQLGNATLRITTRQAIQFHGVRKGGLKPLIQVLNQHLLTSLSACGDVVRNVVACPAPFSDRQRAEISQYAKALSDRLKPRSRAYYEIWLDGEKAASLEEVEPLYGQAYLPRKFKIAFAFPGDNCVDVYTQDIGIVPWLEKDELKGFTLLVGGGLGQSHGAKDTHPVLAKPLTTIKPEQLFEVVEAIVRVQRDHGRRDERKLARMKYLVEAWGLERFKTEVEHYVGYSLPEAQPLTWQCADDHLGWHEQGNGQLFFGLFVENGRVKDHLRVAIREVVKRLNPEIRLTPQQNILFTNIQPGDQATLEAILREHGVELPGRIPLVVQQAMACPALPTCGLAITESERVMPQVIREIDTLLSRLDLQTGPIPHVRMTGCPNGCARPYTAEIGLVGRSLNSYTIYLGGSPLGDRLGEVYLDNVKREDIAARLEPALMAYRQQRRENESFGEFCHRVGIEFIREQIGASVEDQPSAAG